MKGRATEERVGARWPRRLAFAAMLLTMPSLQAAVVPLHLTVPWQFTLSMFTCPQLGSDACGTPYLAMMGSFGFTGSAQGPISTTALSIDGESSDDRHKGELDVIAGESLAFALVGTTTEPPLPPPVPPGVPIPYPNFAFAPGTTSGNGLPMPVTPPEIDLGAHLDGLWSGPIFAFDQDNSRAVQVGTWSVALGPRAVPEPQMLGLVTLALASAVWTRRHRPRQSDAG